MIRRQQPVQAEPLPEGEVHLGHVLDVEAVRWAAVCTMVSAGVRGTASTAIRAGQLVRHPRCRGSP